MARGHILHIFPTFGFGGVQLRIADVANRLGSAYRHTAIALDGRIDARARLWPETPFQVEDGSALPAGLSQLSAIRQHLQGYAADLLCSYNWGSMDWALAASGRGGPPVWRPRGQPSTAATSPAPSCASTRPAASAFRERLRGGRGEWPTAAAQPFPTLGATPDPCAGGALTNALRDRAGPALDNTRAAAADRQRRGCGVLHPKRSIRCARKRAAAGGHGGPAAPGKASRPADRRSGCPIGGDRAYNLRRRSRTRSA